MLYYIIFFLYSVPVSSSSKVLFIDQQSTLYVFNAVMLFLQFRVAVFLIRGYSVIFKDWPVGHLTAVLFRQSSTVSTLRHPFNNSSSLTKDPTVIHTTVATVGCWKDELPERVRVRLRLWRPWWRLWSEFRSLASENSEETTRRGKAARRWNSAESFLQPLFAHLLNTSRKSVQSPAYRNGLIAELA